jgi:orotate phosphoribosyltransferase
MSAATQTSRERLRHKLQTQSVSWGDFLLSSGARSKYYFDCKLTTLDPEGMFLVGHEMFELIQGESQRLNTTVEAVGGLTMGADPIALATGMTSWMREPNRPLQVFIVRKEAKSHGQTKLIEGNFRPGMKVVVIDDVVTRGDATLKAIKAVEEAGGVVAFVTVLVDREQGGCDKIRALGHDVFALFKRSELIAAEAELQPPTASADSAGAVAESA